MASLRRIARLVFPHAFAEESVLWPELRRLLPDGDALTLQSAADVRRLRALGSRGRPCDARVLRRGERQSTSRDR